jgi:transposase
MLHRARDLLVRQRTQLINALRAHLAELAIIAAAGRDGANCTWPSLPVYSHFAFRLHPEYESGHSDHS